MKHNIPTSFSIYWWRELHTSGKRPERQTETNTNRIFTSKQTPETFVHQIVNSSENNANMVLNQDRLPLNNYIHNRNNSRKKIWRHTKVIHLECMVICAHYISHIPEQNNLTYQLNLKQKQFSELAHIKSCCKFINAFARLTQLSKLS